MNWKRASGWSVLAVTAGASTGCDSLLAIDVFPDDAADAFAGEADVDSTPDRVDARAPRADESGSDDAARITSGSREEDGATDARDASLSADAGSDSTDGAGNTSSGADAASDSPSVDASPESGASSGADAASDSASADAFLESGGSCGDACLPSCPEPSGANLVVNGDFATNVDDWITFDPDIVLAFAQDDATQCPSSGSVLATNQAPDGLNSGFYQCVPVTAGQSYDAGAWIRTPSGGAHGQTFVQINWFSGPGCTGALTSATELEASGTFDTWELLSQDDLVVPAGNASAQVYGQIIKNFTDTRSYQTYFDRIYLSLSPAHF